MLLSSKIGLTKDLKIKAFEAEFLQNSGAAADLSPAIAERTLFSCNPIVILCQM